MQKEAVVMVVDVSSTMDQDFSEGGGSRLKMALQCVTLTLQQKIINNLNHHFSFCIFGDEKTQQNNTFVLHPLAKPDLDLVRKIHKMSQMKMNNHLTGGDIFQAIEFVCRLLKEHDAKYIRRIFLFTNGAGQTIYNQQQILKLCNIIKTNKIKLNIIAIDFMLNYDIESNKLAENQNSQMSQIQRQNALFLMFLKENQQQSVQIFTAFLAIELYKKFRIKQTTPTILYKGPLQVAPGLQILCETYKAVRKQKIKPMQKYNMNEPFDPFLSPNKEVLIQTVFYREGDDSKTVIPKQQQANAYQYGPHLVPMNEILEQNTKILQQRNFKLLGFVPQHRIPRHSFISQVDIVVPKCDDVGHKLFTALVHSMLSLQHYAIARYVPRTTKCGVNPRMVVLIPHRNIEEICFFAIQLPTVEDVRDYPFNQLKRANSVQKQLVRELITKLTLEDEEIQTNSTFNYLKQYLYQTLFHRVLHNDNDVPPLDPRIQSYMQPQRNKYTVTSLLMKQIKKQFKLTEKQLHKEVMKSITAWKDLLSTDGESIGEVENAKPFMFQEEQQIIFDSTKPIVSFRRMLNNQQKDLVESALKSLTQFIFTKVSIGQEHKEVINLVKELRKGCLEQKEEEYWDCFLDDFVGRCDQYLILVREEGLGYLKKSNALLFETDKNNLHPLQMVYDDLD